MASVADVEPSGVGEAQPRFVDDGGGGQRVPTTLMPSVSTQLRMCRSAELLVHQLEHARIRTVFTLSARAQELGDLSGNDVGRGRCAVVQ